MEADKDYLKDIQDIRMMMDKSSQFLSLSGLSGIMAGIYALLGAAAGKYIYNLNYGQYIIIESKSFKAIIAIAIGVLILSVLTAYILTAVKAKKRGETIWNTTTKRLLVNFLIPLVTGGIFALLLIKNRYYGLISPITLIFYGLACVNASKYTLRDVRYLGLTIIIIGLLATAFMGYGLEFWALGFGVCHIVYGTVMYFKYDRKDK
ncbi:hypothetical protein DVK85_11780 [Flavobacterium arcticum]|uniref:Uncharacterized protein n=1 Tax=Flavobacterium arcticum TaxID=1784713 RepID=A0A345HE60_9FLAO|nr:hypothetical protein [Flavobacterium arcticum]AXG74870.1 hypothetical protein DVK85_11780 [Flavobacterium arcticum]KAF2509632.1 hypothetical protein E0W72_08895 [Flavobacterium arcticum]